MSRTFLIHEMRGLGWIRSRRSFCVFQVFEFGACGVRFRCEVRFEVVWYLDVLVFRAQVRNWNNVVSMQCERYFVL